MLALVALLAAGAAKAQDCTSEFAAGTPPALINANLRPRSLPLCFDGFALLYSGLSRTPLYAAEHLTSARVAAARRVRRVNMFHPEDRVPPGERAELSDYARSGYDRGHMAPSGDMPDAASQADSFSLSNMVPQAPELNRGLWEGVESTVRALARREGEVYVVTGPLFRGEGVQALNGRVLVPTETWKAVYDPAVPGAAAYVCTNTNAPACRTTTVAEIEQLSGIDVFPALAADLKATAMPLPPPEPHGKRRRRGGTPGNGG